MDTAISSDEEKYANESFENDSDTEIPEISETESEHSMGREVVLPHNTMMHLNYQKGFTSRANSQKNTFVAYDSTSDDEAIVVISETIAEINTIPMRLEEAPTSLVKIDGKQIPDDKLPHKQLNEHKHEAQDMKIGQELYVLSDEIRETNVVENLVADISENRHDYDVDVILTNSLFHSSLKDGDLVENSNIQSEAASYINTTYAEPNKTATHLANADNRQCEENSPVKAEIEMSTKPNIGFNSPEAQYQYHIDNHTPTSFNSSDYTFHMNFVRKCSSNEKLRIRTLNRKSFSFSNERVREIERENHILLRKILTQKPTYMVSTPNSNIQNKFTTTKLSTSALNRKKQQRQIDIDNQALKRKIEAISLRPLQKN